MLISIQDRTLIELGLYKKIKVSSFQYKLKKLHIRFKTLLTFEIKLISHLLIFN